MAERKRVRSLEESLAPPAEPEPPSPPEPEELPEAVAPSPAPPVDLSASVRRLEARQARWIRQRERWRKIRKGEPDSTPPETGAP
jgi:hypothetical protein